MPSIFYKQNIFEVFGMIVAGDYAALAKLYHEPFRNGYSDEQLAQLLKRRLQCHGPELAMRIGKTNKNKGAANAVKGEGKGAGEGKSA